LFIDLVGSNPTYIYIYYVCVFGWNNHESKTRQELAEETSF
jgi:hypothetical protein